MVISRLSAIAVLRIDETGQSIIRSHHGRSPDGSRGALRGVRGRGARPRARRDRARRAAVPRYARGGARAQGEALADGAGGGRVGEALDPSAAFAAWSAERIPGGDSRRSERARGEGRRAPAPAAAAARQRRDRVDLAVQAGGPDLAGGEEGGGGSAAGGEEERPGHGLPVRDRRGARARAGSGGRDRARRGGARVGGHAAAAPARAGAARPHRQQGNDGRPRDGEQRLEARQGGGGRRLRGL